MPKLLIRDLRQVVSPAGRDAPLRGGALAELDLIENGYVLCDGATIEAVGPMSELGLVDSEVEDIDASGLCAIPGLVDCHTHPAFGGDRVEEFSLRAGGAGYEELHAAGGGILSTVQATREAGEEGLRRAVERHRGWMLNAGTTTFEGKSGYGLDRETELASLRAVGAAGRRPDLPRRALDAAGVRGRGRLSRLPARRRAPGRGPARRGADVFLERGAFDAAQARRYLEACREHGLALRLHGDQFTEAGAIPLAVELGARSVDHLEATGADGIAALAASDVTGVLLPASALFLGRPMPPGRALVDAGAAVALATDFNPGSAFCESLPVVMSLAATQLRLSPAEALSACTVNGAHVLGRADRVGRLAPGYAADIVLLDAPDWRYVAYHLAGDVIETVIKNGAAVAKRAAY